MQIFIQNKFLVFMCYLKTKLPQVGFCNVHQILCQNFLFLFLLLFYNLSVHCGSFLPLSGLTIDAIRHYCNSIQMLHSGLSLIIVSSYYMNPPGSKSPCGLWIFYFVYFSHQFFNQLSVYSPCVTELFQSFIPDKRYDI